MKKIGKAYLLILGFSAGALTGMFIRLGFEIIEGRPVSVGGEGLVLPLIAVLLCAGAQLGQLLPRKASDYSRGFDDGYRYGFEDGNDNSRDSGKTNGAGNRSA